MKKSDNRWKRLSFVWEEFKELPFILRNSIYFLITIIVLYIGFSIAKLNPKVEKYADSIFNKYFPDSTAAVTSSTTTVPTTTTVPPNTTTIVPPKSDTSKNEITQTKSNIKKESIKQPVTTYYELHHRESEMIIAPDLKEIHILYSTHVSEGAISEFKENLENRFRKVVKTVSRDTDENENVIKLPIENEHLRNSTAKSLARILKITKFDDVKKNEELSTIIYINKL